MIFVCEYDIEFETRGIELLGYPEKYSTLLGGRGLSKNVTKFDIGGRGSRQSLRSHPLQKICVSVSMF